MTTEIQNPRLEMRDKAIAQMLQHIADISDDAKRDEYIRMLRARIEKLRAQPIPGHVASPSSANTTRAFTEPAPIPSGFSVRQPGDALALVILQVTKQGPCGLCTSMKEKMNGWGWIGCWQNRDEICEFLVKQAESRGIIIEKSTVAGLLVAAIKTAWTGMPTEEAATQV
jgi:hypothetical protein